MKFNKSFLLALMACAFIAQPTFAADDVCKTEEGFLDTTDMQAIGLLGNDEKGIGGTGEKVIEARVTGVIYAYGSICVNGLRIVYDDSQSVKDGNAAYPAKDLKLGQVVNVHASRKANETSFKATSIEAQNAIEGPVTGIDADQDIVYVMNRAVKIEGDGALSALQAGTPVRASGLYNREGELVASLLTLKEAAAPDTATGLLEKRVDGGYTIGGVLVDLSRMANTMPSSENVIRAEGAWTNGKLVVERLSARPLKPAVSQKTYISFEGYLNSFSEDKRVRLNGIDTVAKDLLCGGEPLEVGERLIGMGVISPDGSIKIDGFVDQEAPHTELLLTK